MTTLAPRDIHHRKDVMPTWQAQMITADDDTEGAPLLRRQFTLDQDHGDVQQAILRFTAQGVCEVSVNGSPVTDELLTPGWTSYEWRLQYHTVDVTSHIAPTTVIGIALGNGWSRGRLTWQGLRGVYGPELGAFAQLDIDYADGHRQTVVTDSSWQSHPSAILANDLYDGQTIDARRRNDAWQEPGPSLMPGWAGTHPIEFDIDHLTPQRAAGVTRQDRIAPVTIWTSPQGKTLVDFGQNLVGWIRLDVTGPAGHEITVRHAEALEDKELAIRPLRTALATDRYILSGGRDVFEPTFTFHGFRYAEIDGWPHDTLDPAALTAMVVGSDLRRTGRFSCSNPDLNQLHQNVVWSQRGNFLSVPTDCPQRDERLGWTGDLAVFAPTAAYLFDVSDFLRGWLADLAVEQAHHDNIVPFVVPDVLKYAEGPTDFPAQDTTAIWSDAAVWVPWALWQAYGDSTVLHDQFESIMGHSRRVARLLSPDGLWVGNFQFGDWLDPDAPPDKPADAKADPSVVATACAYYTASLASEIAGVLGRAGEQEEMTVLAARTRAAFNEHYVDELGRITSDCTTVYALAIRFGVLDDSDRAAAGARLSELVAQSGYKISTGFAGTPFVTDALTDTGHLDDAYRLLLERDCPSWLYPVTMGATTIWERWDSMLPDGTINPGEMTSFNHYALGAVADWMHRTIGGIAPLEPGYKTILIAPQPGGDLTWAEASLDTPHGEVRVRWERLNDQLKLQVTVPEQSRAIVRLSGREDEPLAAGDHEIVAAL